MKQRFALHFFLVPSLAALALLNGCSQQSASTAPAYVTTSSVTQPGARIAPPPPPLGQPSHTQSVIAQQPLADAASASPVAVSPEKLRVSQPLSEVIRLAQSGVDEGVIMTYITNSSAAFRLGAEEIVYLNDLGISSGVITGMMQRDQALKTAPPRSAQTIAVAPAYVNPPQTIATQESQPVVVADNYFYDSLSPYGSWIEVEGYGRCWRPTVAMSTSSWRPYCDRGHWIYTDSGWYWMSDYSWGSIAFHYGRWLSHPRWGWCWWPDSVWGPSWVSWRYDNDNCGWAPLPPLSYYRSGAGFTYRDRNVGFSFDFGLGIDSFTFVQWGRFCDPRPYQHCLPRQRVNTIYNQTTIVSDFGDGRTVVNRGVSAEHVRERSRSEVRTVSLRDETPRRGEVRAERLERGGKTLIVPRPVLPVLPALPVLPPLPGLGKISSSFQKSSERAAPTAAATPITATSSPKIISREERREVKSGIEHLATPPVSVPPPAAALPVAKPTPQPDASGDIRTSRSEQRIEVQNIQRERTQTEATPRSARPPTPTPTPARTATPIFTKPVVVETVPHAPSRPVIAPSQDSTAVIGNGRIRSGGRDYSVWSTAPQPQPAPTQQPAPSVSAPDFNRSISHGRAVDETPAQVENNPPPRPTQNENRSENNFRREERNDSRERGNRAERSLQTRFEQRIQQPVVATPAPTPAPTFAPAPAPVQRPAPTFTPPPAARIESQPASARPEPRSESRSESKSDFGRPRRER